MNTSGTKTLGTDPQILADLEAVMTRIKAGKRVDPKIRRRIRKRAERITEEIRQKHGELDVAVELIRETRDEV